MCQREARLQMSESAVYRRKTLTSFTRGVGWGGVGWGGIEWSGVEWSGHVFLVLFLGLVIFQTPLFSDEVGPYAEFQRSLINLFTHSAQYCFSSSLLLHM